MERNTARGGKDSIDHPKGAHDDVADAVAGALLLAVAKKPRIWVGGGLGVVTYRPDLNDGCVPSEGGQPVRVVPVTITEKEALEAGERTAPQDFFRARPRRRRFG